MVKARSKPAAEAACIGVVAVVAATERKGNAGAGLRTKITAPPSAQKDIHEAPAPPPAAQAPAAAPAVAKPKRDKGPRRSDKSDRKSRT